MKKEKYDITGMSCAACSSKVEREVSKLKGMDSCQVNLLTNSMKVEYDENELSSKEIIDSVVNAGYGASLRNTDSRLNASKTNDFKDAQSKEIAQMEYRLKVSFVFLAILMYISMGSMIGLPLPILSDDKNAANFALTQLLLVLPVMYVNRKYYINGFKALFKRSPNMDSLIAVGSSAAFVHGIVYLYQMSFMLANNQIEMAVHYKHNLYFESISMILTLVTLGKYFETKAKSKTTSAITKLLDLAPDMARVLVGQEEKMISTSEVEKGNILIVKPGESIPVDGIIIEGTTSVDESAITGESIPVSKTVGDKITGATINKSGFIKFRATEVGGNTTISKIIALVEEASSSKAPISKLADKVAGVFVPIVMCISLITLIVWLILGENISFALSNAIAVLVISCPCALGLATPVAIMVATGKGAELGILIKSADALETTYKLETIVLDKTGTVTEGKPVVTDIIVYKEFVKNDIDKMTEDNIRFISSNTNLNNKLDKALLIKNNAKSSAEVERDRRELLRLAASIESASEHPLAEAIIKKAQESKIDLLEVVDFESEPGSGISANLKGINNELISRIYAGNARMLNSLSKKGLLKAKESSMAFIKLGNSFAADGKTPLYFVQDENVLGVIAVADVIKKDSARAVKTLRKDGLEVILLTGDNENTARAVAKQSGIDEVIAEVLPTEKESKIRELMEAGKKVAMVGDGINDAPALARADVGIAIGAGTDIAIESADIVLMNSSLLDVASAIELSKATINKIKQNLFWAFFYNCIGIPLAAGVFYHAFGWSLSPMFGAAAMSLSSVCVVSNALLLKRFKKNKTESRRSRQSESSVTKLSENVTENVVNEENNKVEDERKIMNSIVLNVDGMMCEHCKATVEKAVSKLDGIESVNADLEAKKVTVLPNKDIDVEEIKKAITNAGYEVK